MSGDAELPVWDHLDELAKRLRIIIVSVAVSAVAVSSLPADLEPLLKLNWDEYKPLLQVIIESIMNNLLPTDVNLIALSWVDTFYVYFLLAVVIGTLVSSPIIAYEIYRFVRPALYASERRGILGFTLAFTLLFGIGGIYAYFVLLPITFMVLMRFVYSIGAIPYFAVREFFDVVFLGILGSGLFYTFPLLITFLVRLEIVEPDDLRRNRRIVLVVLLVATAVITPDPTPLTMLLMSIPFYLLYELSILIGNRIQRSKKRRTQTEAGT